MPEIVIIIPSRYASTRFPGKPLADIGGKTMIRRVWEQCSAAALAERVIIATDDERIVHEVESFGGEAFITPSNLNSGSERVAFVAQRVSGDIFVNVQGDEPLIPPATIDNAIKALIDNEKADIGTVACPIRSFADFVNPNVVKAVCAQDGRALYFSRASIPFSREERHSIAGCLKHIGVYAFRRAALERFASLPENALERCERLEQLRALEDGMTIHVSTVESDTVAVDAPEDIALVLERLNAKHAQS
jgi:3-deoxy-manno-octulosonate cytidylyltransferase (CMP-KDO synthetase)